MRACTAACAALPTGCGRWSPSTAASTRRARMAEKCSAGAVAGATACGSVSRAHSQPRMSTARPARWLACLPLCLARWYRAAPLHGTIAASFGGRFAMRMNPIRHSLVLAGLLMLVGPVTQAAGTPHADDYRGGWESEPGAGAPHVLEFSIRAPKVRGIYCSECNDATTLAFIDGSLAADGLTF